MKLRFAAVLLLLVQTALLYAAEPRSEHTFGLAEGAERPAATLADAAWLVGNWEGEAFGQRFQENWQPAVAGSMVGSFKLYGDEGVSMYEILLLEVENNTLSLKVKHFNPDFTAWEEKEDFINFRLVAMEPDALHFGGISFYRRSPDRIDTYMLMNQGGVVSEQHLVYRRQVARGAGSGSAGESAVP